MFQVTLIHYILLARQELINLFPLLNIREDKSSALDFHSTRKREQKHIMVCLQIPSSGLNNTVRAAFIL
ncbi:hypothetical protein LINGRAPRIM_LOCUS2879 [Linum grandiflorum]